MTSTGGGGVALVAVFRHAGRDAVATRRRNNRARKGRTGEPDTISEVLDLFMLHLPSVLLW
jgi:hypothetical protein